MDVPRMRTPCPARPRTPEVGPSVQVTASLLANEGTGSGTAGSFRPRNYPASTRQGDPRHGDVGSPGHPRRGAWEPVFRRQKGWAVSPKLIWT